MRDRIFYSICFGFIFGVFLRSLFDINIFAVLLVSLLALAFLFIFALIIHSKHGVLAVVFILSISLGIFRFHLADVLPSHTYDSVGGTEIEVEGEIIDDPDLRDTYQKFVVEENISGIVTKFLVSADLSETYKYGDRVSFVGKVDQPENFITDSGKEFDYVNYLRKDGIFYLINFAEVEKISGGNGNKIKSVLFAVKHKFLEKINSAVPSPENLLLSGLILGEKSNFSDELRKSFVDTGTIHIVALSGYNITIVAEWFMALFSFLPQMFAISMGILAILLFIIMTGSGSTGVRAGIMATLALYARATGRNYDVGRALLLAGVMMILVNPFVLAFDVSFQLSFIATVALIFFTPRIEKYFLWIPKRFMLRETVSVTFAVYIFVLPFLLYKMGNLSFVALPANVFVLPLIPLTMAFGFITSFLGMIHYVLAVPFGYVSYLLLHYELGVIGFFAHIPFASISIPNFPLFLTILTYIYFIYRLWWRGIKELFIERV